MKSKLITLFIAAVTGLFVSCDDKDYALGMSEYDHHYYIAYEASNNSQVTVQKSSPAILKFPVQFHSVFTRTYDAIGHYRVIPAATNPAVVGVDFNIVDRNGNAIQAVDGKYSLIFPNAVRKVDTIYVKLLNNPAPGTRTAEIQLMENVTPEYRVDTMSTAFRRPLRIQ